MLDTVELRDPSSDVEEGKPALARHTGRRWALMAGIPLAMLIAVLWVERRPIAEHYIGRTLRAHHVPARYRIAELGPGRQILTDVVIGNPRHPDLVADWIETRTGIGLSGVELVGISAGQVRLRGRIVGGRLSLGTIDRLLPTSSRKAGGLPSWVVEIADARMRLDTPAGPVGVALTGRGRLDDGFVGRAAISGASLASGGCGLTKPHAMLRVTTRRGGVGLAGPVEAARLACGATRVDAPRVTVDLAVDPVRSAWQGRWQVAGGFLVDPRGRAASLAGSGTVGVQDGRASGRLAIALDRVVAAGIVAARASVSGDYALGADREFRGRLGASGVSLRDTAVLKQWAAAVAGTPVAALADRAGNALVAAARSLSGTATVRLVQHEGTTRLGVTQAVIAAPTGASARFEGDADPAGPIDGRVTIAGGGLPGMTATLRRPDMRSPIAGTLTLTPYANGGATLALTPASFSVAPDGALRVATLATLSGPLSGGGRVERLTMPLALRRSVGGDLMIGESCAPVSFARLITGGLRLDAARLVLCPVDGALVRVGARGAVGGGARIGALRLGGRLGDSPFTIEATGASIALGTRGFTVGGVAATLGAGENPTRLAAASLNGTLAGGGGEGRFTDLGGRIGAVPLLLSKGEGNWGFAGGALDLGGALTVTDADAAHPACVAGAADPPRFCPLFARDVALRLADGRIVATGTLAEPTTGARVAGVTIAHDLASGAGHADLAVSKLDFAKDGLQPVRLTPVTEGIIAEVAGTVDGDGHIGWSDAGVTSTGRFATAGLDLAAAFGPVTGIAGSIAFTDLLGLVSAPGQQVTVKSINPGVLVEDGIVRFHTDAGVKVAFESARWPFAGGTLTLDPTLLDFSAPAERRLTFRVDGVAADRFLQQFDFKNLAATGTFDGVLPMIFDAGGGRIAGGHLTVRESGGGIAYVGDLSEKDLGTWGNLAFQALKSLRYRSLSILMNGPLDGEMVTEVRFAGISQGVGAKSNFLIRRLQRLPFVFNVKIKAPFRELLQTTGSLSDPSDLIRRNLPALLAPPVQPGASAPVPEAKRP